MAGKGFALNPQCINRLGRPRKGKTLTGILQSKLQKKLPYAVGGEWRNITGRDYLALRLIELAKSGDSDTALAAIKYIIDRIDGKPVETVKAEVQGGLSPMAILPERQLELLFEETAEYEIVDEAGDEGAAEGYEADTGESTGSGYEWNN
ncbi:MAG: hypothetical protein LBF78_06005 [Treponema sp.]|jgi:hypothetical protein|nr:hypothetical protein [Treponema sp.]